MALLIYILYPIEMDINVYNLHLSHWLSIVNYYWRKYKLHSLNIIKIKIFYCAVIIYNRHRNYF